MALAPAGFTQTIDRQAYVTAHRAAALKRGALRYRLPMTFLAAALLVGAAVTVWRNSFSAAFWMTAAVMALLAAAIIWVWFWWLPKREADGAGEAFAVYDRLMNPSEICFGADVLTIRTPQLTREDNYARMRLCIETPERFVLCTDDNTVLILEKADFAEKERTTAFLREVFVRRYAKGH